MTRTQGFTVPAAVLGMLALVPGRCPAEEGTWLEVAKLLAEDPSTSAHFAERLAIDGDRVAVGAWRGGALDRGAIYLFERHAGGLSQWGQVAKLTGASAGVSANLGLEVAIDGDRVAGTAPFDEGGDGAAYVFDRQADGSWAEVAKLTAPDATDTFATGGVAIEGDTVFVGEEGDDDAGILAGAVYVFERDAGGPGNWGPVDKLVAADPSNDARFGDAVAVDGDVLVVGARRDDDLVNDAGAAHIFERDVRGQWVEVVKLLASDGDSSDGFGDEVGVEGQRVVVGAEGHRHDGVVSGSAYVYERRREGQWIEVAELLASDGEDGDNFGGGVAVDGDRVVVGARGEDLPGSESGAVYVFERDPVTGSWSEVVKLEASDAVDSHAFGVSVGVKGDTVVAGAHGDDTQGSNTGAAYIFREADVTLSLTGSCPGEVTLAVSGATPRGPVVFLGAQAEGTTVLPPGLCGGTQLGLLDPIPLGATLADPGGALSLTRTVADPGCGLLLQAVDVGICVPSNVAPLP